MLSSDRLLSAFHALIKSATPRLDYMASYKAAVVQFNEDDQTVDVLPADPRVPSMARVPFLHGTPGTTVAIRTGTTVLISWSGGDPSEPFAESWGGGESVKRLTISAEQITLGSEAGAEPAAKGQTLQTYLNNLAAALVSHTHPVSGALAAASAPLAVPGVITPPVITATKVSVA